MLLAATAAARCVYVLKRFVASHTVYSSTKFLFDVKNAVAQSRALMYITRVIFFLVCLLSSTDAVFWVMVSSRWSGHKV